MKIYLGNLNIASLFDDLRAGFEALGHEVFTVATSSNDIRSGTDLDAQKLLSERIAAFDKKFPAVSREARNIFIEDSAKNIRELALAHAAQADICVFFVKSFLPFWQDLPLLKQRGARVAVAFCGSEARVESLENLWRKKSNATPASSSIFDLETTLRLVRQAEANADAVLGGTWAGLRPSYLPMTTIYDASSTPFHVNRDRTRPVILHAPSHRGKKGSEIWLRIFAELRDEGFDFDVRLVENLRHKDLLNLLADADIMCDGLFFGGKLAREGMASGCAVLSAFGDNHAAWKAFFDADEAILRAKYKIQAGSEEDKKLNAQYMKKAWYYDPAVNPCIDVKPETAKDKLRALLADREKRIALAERGRKAIAEYCDPAMVCRDILQCVLHPDTFDTNILLSFYQSLLYYEYVPRDLEEAAIFNKYSDIVKTCQWYKDWRPPLRRDGLIF